MQPATIRGVAAFVSGAALLLGITPGCVTEATPPKRPARPTHVVKTPPAPTHAALRGPALLPAHLVASLEAEDALAVFARRGQEGLLLTSSHGRMLSRLVSADGAPKNVDPIDVAPLPEGVELAALRAVSDGYVAAWVEGVDKNSALKVLSLDAAGKARGAPTLVVQSAEVISWVDLLPNEKGVILLWETPRDDRSDVSIAPIVGGKAASPPAIAVRDALNWHAVGSAQGAAIAAVLAPRGASTNDQDDEDQGSKRGSVALFEVSPAGAVSPPVMVSPERTAHADIDVVEASGSYILAWTDTREIDASVMLAAVAKGGKVTKAPHKATAPFGEQALVSLTAEEYGSGAAPSKKVLLAWEDLLGVPRDGRLIHLATVSPDSAVSDGRASLLFSSSGPPDLVADGDGFAAITLAPTSLQKPGEGGPKDPPIWPVHVRFGPDLSVLAAEPVRAEPFSSTDGVPYFVRGLSCGGGVCTTLAGGSGSPAPLTLVSLPVRESPWRAPARREPPEQPPRASTVTALYEGAHLSRVTASSTEGGASLAAWITYVLEGPAEEGAKGKADDTPGATLGLRPISSQGAPGKTVILSRKALSIGGVSLASAPPPSAGKPVETAVAWVARERGEAQVFVTKVGGDGQKIAQQKLTVVPRKKRDGIMNECSDVAIAYDPGATAGPAAAKGSDGWIIAWVDTRDGNAEVYVAKVDRQLKKIVPDRRITTAPGDSAEVQIVVRGKEAFLVWSDARKNPDEGNADIYLARLDARSLQKIGDDTLLFASAGHSRSPSFVAAPTGLSVSWIEEATGEGGKPAEGSTSAGEPGLRLARVDEKGVVIGAPILVRGDEGAPVTSAALSCGSKACRGMLTSAVGETLLVGSFELPSSGAPSALKTLASLSGGAAQDVSLAFAGAAGSPLFFADNAIGGTGRVRMMTIEWP